LFEGSRFEDMQVSFGASDTGITIGAAAHAWLNHPDTDPASIAAAPVTPYLGPSYDEARSRRPSKASPAASPSRVRTTTRSSGGWRNC
jgi:predicted NodU family carbamoyl transferase